MSSSVSVYSYAHSVTYVAGQMLRSLKVIIVNIGLDPSKLTSQWDVIERGLKAWMDSGHLERVRLEIYDPKTDDFVGGWDFNIDYGYGTGEGEMWADIEQIRSTIIKCGIYPSSCEYRVLVTNKPNYPDVEGWSSASARSTDGFVFQSIGTAVGSHSIGAESGYWRKK